MLESGEELLGSREEPSRGRLGKCTISCRKTQIAGDWKSINPTQSQGPTGTLLYLIIAIIIPMASKLLSGLGSETRRTVSTGKYRRKPTLLCNRWSASISSDFTPKTPSMRLPDLGQHIGQWLTVSAWNRIVSCKWEMKVKPDVESALHDASRYCLISSNPVAIEIMTQNSTAMSSHNSVTNLRHLKYFVKSLKCEGK